MITKAHLGQSDTTKGRGAVRCPKARLARSCPNRECHTVDERAAQLFITSEST